MSNEAKHSGLPPAPGAAGVSGARPAAPASAGAAPEEKPNPEEKPKGARLRAYLEEVSADLLSRCTRCGKCVEACPMRAYAPELQGAQPAAVVTGVLGLLQGIPAEAPSLGWLRVCSFSGACVPACPEGLDPMMMVRVARMGAYGAMGAPAQLTDRDDPKFFRRINAFAQLQLSDAEIAQWHD